MNVSDRLVLGPQRCQLMAPVSHRRCGRIGGPTSAHHFTIPEMITRALFSQSATASSYLGTIGPVEMPFALIDDGDAGVIVSWNVDPAPRLRMSFDVHGRMAPQENMWVARASAVIEVLRPHRDDPRFELAHQALRQRFSRQNRLAFTGPLLWGTITDWAGWAVHAAA